MLSTSSLTDGLVAKHTANALSEPPIVAKPIMDSDLTSVNQRSLRRRLMAFLMGLSAILVILVSLASYYFACREIERVGDAQLLSLAQTLQAMIGGDLVSLNTRQIILEAPQGSLQNENRSPVLFRIWEGEQLLLRSYDSRVFRHTPLKTGFNNLFVDDVWWRIYTLRSPFSDVIVEVAEEHSVRTSMAMEILNSVLWPLLLLLPLMVTVVWFGVNRGLAPLSRLSSAVARRSRKDLAPVHMDEQYTEIAPLVVSINQLLERLQAQVEKERRFIDNAAHELRTPLAVLKTQVQVALRMQNPKQCEQLLGQLVDGVDRATHLLNQLLEFSRYENAELPMTEVDLVEQAEQVVRQFYPIAQQKGVDLRLVASQKPVIEANAAAVQVALRNLLQNAIRHTAENGQVEVRLEQSNGTISLGVLDTGTGIPEEIIGKVCERFYQAGHMVEEGSDKDSLSHGAGLGLAMVSSITEAHGAKFTIRNRVDRHGVKAMMVWFTAKKEVN